MVEEPWTLFAEAPTRAGKSTLTVRVSGDCELDVGTYRQGGRGQRSARLEPSGKEPQG